MVLVRRGTERLVCCLWVETINGYYEWNLFYFLPFCFLELALPLESSGEERNPLIKLQTGAYQDYFLACS